MNRFESIQAEHQEHKRRPCPECGAQVGESCINQRTNEYRITVHEQRKKPAA